MVIRFIIVYFYKISCISAELFHASMKVLHSNCIIFVWLILYFSSLSNRALAFQNRVEGLKLQSGSFSS
ncbi:hypothetical protein F2Y83_25345 [Bacteroides cellulosilyticus]|uniref:Uncharacterized protein n=1 Tax=Bacteroides intestinalis TaxID=329854 RepID=A0A3E4KPK2_9BACE|nr:hypothetical protein F3B37_02055 [Bacteroides intestinalis]KAA5423922.1 hypothetical protein F2Y70_20720 [Bacteroides cellulosilyticus]KAA4718675.1 hypothetical protein F3B35_12335 [Bacteroides intestinalis]KAA5429989.1 hypothetical protein F2Y83_25345 [Bacteroides cellulosilyticus]KAA5443355.1 hypothetical protein F2Y74_02390 [Bacteroides cellulosilyticus]